MGEITLKFQKQRHDYRACQGTEYLETGQGEKRYSNSMLFFSLAGKCTNCSSPCSFIIYIYIYINICPSGQHFFYEMIYEICFEKFWGEGGNKNRSKLEEKPGTVK